MLTETDNTISKVIAKALPSLSGDHLTYNAAKNVFVTNGYSTNCACYYRAIRLSDRLAVYYYIGDAPTCSFLNGISIYACNGNGWELIAEKRWGGRDNYCFFNEAFAKDQSIIMLKNYLASVARQIGASVSDSEIESYSRNLIESIHRKQLA